MISVIIPTYNRGYTIHNSIDSVLNQSYDDLELIIVDDGSTDNTKDIINSYNDKRIKYVYQENAGACVARNTGISIAQGEYIAFQDSDDIWLPNKLETQIKVINETGADIVTCQMHLWNEDNSKTIIPDIDKSCFFTLKTLPVGFSTQTLFVKNEVAKKIKFDPNMPRLQDVDWLIRAVKEYKLYFIKQEFVTYSVYPDSISSDLNRLYNAIKLINSKYPNLKRDVPCVSKTLSEAMIYQGMTMMQNGYNEYKKYLSLGAKLSNNKKHKLLYWLIKLGLYNICHLIYHSIKSSH